MNKGQILDTLLSTSDSGFNHSMQDMIWKHTANKPRGTLIPDDSIIEYMDVLHKTFFYCIDNHKTPYACIGYLSEIAKDDAYLLCLVDSILYLMTQSDRGDEMLILYGTLVDLRHQLAPWDEDEYVKSIMNEMKEQRWQVFARPPLSQVYSKPLADNKPKLSNRQHVLIYFYEGGKMLEKKHKDYDEYNTFCTPQKRLNYSNGSLSKLRPLISDIEKTLPHLSKKARQQAESELNTLRIRLIVEK